MVADRCCYSRAVLPRIRVPSTRGILMTKANLSERVAACCPCRKRYKCGGYSDHVCCGPYEQPCRCEEPATETARECTSTVHELAAEVGELEHTTDERMLMALGGQRNAEERAEAAERLLVEVVDTIERL